MGYLTADELQGVGFKEIGADVLVSTRAALYGVSNITLGDHCRIDDFCLLSAGEGGIQLGRYVHIGCYSSLIGQGPIVLEDFSGVSGRVSIYSSNDDFSGNSIPLPTVPAEFRNPDSGEVRLCKYTAVGAGSIIFPNVTVGEGTVIGTRSVVTENCGEFGVYKGNPLRRVAYRSKTVMNIARQLTGSS